MTKGDFEKNSIKKAIKNIEKQLGRPLRVLHIGNIANNAYKNCLALRRYGIEADVLCYDYYHIMACPEWEESAFRGQVDDLYPDWFSTSLRGWSRPRWFVQGPIKQCMQYLRARHRLMPVTSCVFWYYLQVKYWEIVDNYKKKDDKTARNIPKLLEKIKKFVEKSNLSNFEYDSYLREYLNKSLSLNSALDFDSSCISESTILTEKGFSRFFISRRLVFLHRLFNCFYEFICILLGKTINIKNMLKPEVSAIDIKEKILGFMEKREILMRRGADLSGAEKNLLDSYIKDHPFGFFDVLQYYDIVQGYSIDGFIPWMNGVKNFASYEHGTIRDIPWEPTFVGTICRLTYQNSPAVFVTNSDVLPSVARLCIDDRRVAYIPHGFDDFKINRWLKINRTLRPPLDHTLRVLCPARQHWKTGSPSWRKGNDLIIRALAELRKKGMAIEATFVEWGAEVAESKALIAELGVEDCCHWVRPMRKSELWTAYCRAHVVLDQFVMPAIGAVAYEVMAIGRRVITRIDREQLETFFGEVPPVMAAETVSEIMEALEAVARDPEDKAGIGARCAAWIRRYHSTERIVKIHLNVYDSLLAGKLSQPSSKQGELR